MEKTNNNSSVNENTILAFHIGRGGRFRETYYEDMELALAVAVNCISDEQIVHLTSREDIDGEEAELIRFTYGKYDDTCVAVRYNDGTIFFPYDWHSSYWDNEDWKIEDTRWIDVRGMEAINLNGMPRLLL